VYNARLFRTKAGRTVILTPNRVCCKSTKNDSKHNKTC
jgi:hypothetical protein